MIKESILTGVSILALSGTGWQASVYLDENFARKEQLIITQNTLSNSLYDYRTQQLRTERKQTKRRMSRELDESYKQYQRERIQEIEEELEDLQRLKDVGS